MANRWLNFTFPPGRRQARSCDGDGNDAMRCSRGYNTLPVYYARYRDRHFYACEPQSGELIYTRNLIAAPCTDILLFRGEYIFATGLARLANGTRFIEDIRG